jgi:hypothetical protein
VAQTKQKAENLPMLLEQHWSECKHIESERAWFMSVYGAIAGGILAFVAKGLDTNSVLNNFSLFYVLTFSFLIVLTFFGFFLTLRWIYAFECHRNRVGVILRELGFDKLTVKGKTVDLTMSIPPTGFFKVFSTKILFPLFYLVVLIGITSFLFAIPDLAYPWIKWLSLALSIVALCLGVWWCFLLKKAK